MKQPIQASKASALLSGMALGLGMPTIEAAGQVLGLSQAPQNIAFVFGLVTLFFGPVLMFVVGSEHLSIKSGEMHKRVYWASLGQVALRTLFWLVGCGLGFALLAAVRGLLS